jgi:hypothetical protein
VEVIIVLRLLWRRRLLVILGAVLAVGAAFALGPSPTSARGFALASVLMDTSRSQLVTDAPDGVDSLSWRATLAGQLLGTDASRQSIAAKAGIDPRLLTVTDLELALPIIPASLPRAAVQTAYSTATPYALNVHTDGIVPIISIVAEAPDRASAARLAEAVVRTLQVNSASTTSEQDLGLAAEQTAPIDAIGIPGGKGRKKMAAVAVVLFGLWVAGMALVPALFGATRTIMRSGESAPA